MSRSRMLAHSTTQLPSAASNSRPRLHSTPIAAVHQSVAAVFRPRTFKPSRMITPPPRKPIPDTT
ncbi:hypothetical protein D3C75_1374890 [compost metagenome]